ncbi:DUF3775 domain-containing protein [Geminicoccaceae bacterium 1502E]|nr:DUF3775 domain-containing protein [Geminicoccaceae bacterium 1502E]
MAELGIDIDKVCYVIMRARAFDAKVEPAEPAGSDNGGNPADEAMIDVLEDTGDDATYSELVTFIGDLNVDEQVTLVALAWLGRGTYTVEEWADARAEARRGHNARTAQYLLGMPLLGDYLEEGLAAFGHSCSE